MEKDGPPRVETVVIYLPDVHSCMPSLEEWQTMTQAYKSAADEIITRRKALVEAAAANANEANDKSQDVEMADNSTANDDDEAAAEEEAQETSVGSETNAAGEDDGETDEVVAVGDDDEEQEENLDDSTATADVSGTAATDDDGEEDGAEAGEPADDEMAEDENVTDHIGEDIVYEQAQKQFYKIVY